MAVGTAALASVRVGVFVGGRAVGRTGAGVAVAGTGVLVGAAERGCEAPVASGPANTGGPGRRASRCGDSPPGADWALVGRVGAGVLVDAAGAATAGWASPRMTASTVLSGVGCGIDLPSLK